MALGLCRLPYLTGVQHVSPGSHAMRHGKGISFSTLLHVRQKVHTRNFGHFGPFLATGRLLRRLAVKPINL